MALFFAGLVAVAAGVYGMRRSGDLRPYGRLLIILGIVLFVLAAIPLMVSPLVNR